MPAFASVARQVAAIALGCCCLAAVPLHAQESAPKAGKGKKAKAEEQDDKVKTPARPTLFDTHGPLAVTFTTNIGQLKGDKRKEHPWRAATLSWRDSSGAAATLPVRVRTRGIWRLAHCQFPPLRLDFPGKASRSTPFSDLGKPKLVSYCRDTDQYEQYLLQELQLYRIYQLLTPASHRVRLLRISYVDSTSGQAEAMRYAFIEEDPDQLAVRLGGRMIDVQGAGPNDLDPAAGALAYVFQYFIGNTDFSFNRLHNGELVALGDGRVLPVAYDFDFAGAVNATYATPDPNLYLRSVRDRSFRGYCAFNDQYPAVLALFREKKDAIYALYRDEVGALLRPDIVDATLRYFDDFYREIEPSRRFPSSCVGTQ